MRWVFEIIARLGFRLLDLVVLIGDDELVDHVIGVYLYAVGCGIASEPAHISVEVSGGNHLLPYNLLAQVFHHLQTDVLTISLARCAFRVSGCEFRVSGRVWGIGFRELVPWPARQRVGGVLVWCR